MVFFVHALARKFLNFPPEDVLLGSNEYAVRVLGSVSLGLTVKDLQSRKILKHDKIWGDNLH